MTNVRIDVVEQAFQYYRQPHDKEMRAGDTSPTTNRTYMGDGYYTGTVRDLKGANALPEVYRLLPDQTVPLSCDWVYFWKDLNPDLTIESFVDTLMDSAWAFMNNTGVPPRKNCWTGAGEGQPSFPSPLICGGAILKGTKSDGMLRIESMLVDNPAPAAQDVLNNKPWLWYYGVMTNGIGNISYMLAKAKDGTKIPVRVPLLHKYPVYLPLGWLNELPLNFLPPNPMWRP